MSRQCMTYGELPSKSAFEIAFNEECPDGYSFGNDEIVGDNTLNSEELWAKLQECRSVWFHEDSELGDKAGDWCSEVLSTLGFEWV